MFEWIKRWKVRREYLQLRLATPKLTDHGASREALRQVLRHLDETRFVHYTKSDGIGVEVTVFYKTIDEYRLELKSLVLRILNEQMIQSSWADQVAKTMGLPEFLTSKEGFYLDIVETIHGFKHECLILCSVLEQIDREHIGVQGHNRRQVIKFVANLRQVTISLIDVSRTLVPTSA